MKSGRLIFWIGCGLLSSCSFGYEVLRDEDSAHVGGDGDLGGAPSSGGTITGDGDGDGDAASGGRSSGGAVSGVGGGSSGGNGSGGAGLGGAGLGGAGLGGSSPYGEPTGTPKVHCATIPFLSDAPILDGYVDPGIYLEPVVPVGWRNASTPLPGGNSALFGAAWRPDGVYFFMVVTDPDRVPAPLPEDEADDWILWQGDAVEIYLDHDGVFDAPLGSYAEMGTRQVIVSAPPSDSEENTERAALRFSDGSSDVYTPYDGALWVSRPIPGGYVVELFIDGAALNLSSWTLQEGSTIGVNFGHNVSGDGAPDGNRLSQYFMKVREPLEGDDNDYPFRNEATFCESLLIVE
jgi:hypothetical protein